MGDFSVKASKKNVHHRKTAEYFEEVISSFEHNNFRAAVVSLYSVVIADLVYKLHESYEIYGDQTAELILNEIRDKQTKNPTSSEWEQYLIDEIIKRTKLLDHNEGENVLHLRKHRHLCAHPVLDQADVLFSPNRETVLAHIRNMVEGVLTKGALLKSDVFLDMVTSLENDKQYLSSEIVLREYLGTKYLNHMGIELGKKVFKSLWRVVFKSDNEQCNANRKINFDALCIMMDKTRNDISELIKEESNYFSQLNDKKEIITLLAAFFYKFPETYEYLEGHAKTILKNNISNERDIVKAYFLNGTGKEHFDFLKRLC